MSDSNVIKLAQPEAFSDSLTEILRSGARALLTQAIEAEVAEFLAKHADLKTGTGQQRVVRHGHLPERAIMTGIGPVAVRQPRVRDREAIEGERIRYSPSILPRYARRSKSLEVLIPVLYLKGISTGDFEKRSASLEPDTISKIYFTLSPEPRVHWDRRGILANPISGTAVLEYGPAEILPPVGAISKHPARLCRPGRQASRGHPRGKPGFSTFESGCGRETDCLLERAGFEPSVTLHHLLGAIGSHRISLWSLFLFWRGANRRPRWHGSRINQYDTASRSAHLPNEHSLIAFLLSTLITI